MAAELTVSMGIVLQLLRGSLYRSGPSWSRYSVRQVEFLARPFGYTIPLNWPFRLAGASLIVTSIDPDRHCIRTVGSLVNIVADPVGGRGRREERHIYQRFGYAFFVLPAD